MVLPRPMSAVRMNPMKQAAGQASAQDMSLLQKTGLTHGERVQFTDSEPCDWLGVTHRMPSSDSAASGDGVAR